MFCSKCGTQIVEDAVFCSKCGTKTTTELEITPAKPQEIAGQRYSAAEIKEYLGHAKTLEVNRYTLIKTRERLLGIIDSLGHRKNIPCPESQASEGFSSFWRIFWGCFITGVIICIFACGDADDSVLANLLSVVTVILLFFNTELLAGVGAALGISIGISLLVCLIRSGAKQAEYRGEVKDYDLRVAEDNKRVAREREQIKGLKQQVTEIGLEINNIDKLLKKYYALNVIYPKYREMIPVITMWEYFDSNRCYALEGSAGAYNLYEYESRMEVIITKVNQAISMLSRIERNQYALYEAIQESNYYAEKMYDRANDMLKSAKAIERNSEIAAYNAKIAAENSTISAYIDLWSL